MRFALAAALCVATTSLAFGQSSYPMLMSIHPIAAQVGQTTEHEVTSRYTMWGATEVLVSGTGVTGEIVDAGRKPGDPVPTPKPNVTKIKIKLTVAPDALPGVRDFKIFTPQGVSTVGQFVVGRDPVVVEQAKNNTPAEAQVFTTPATLCGTVEAVEDVDFYKFKAAAGSALSFHVQCTRLQDRIHDLQAHADLIIFLRDANGSVLASADNNFYADPFLKYEFKQDGDYLLEVRDVRYQGNVEWRYSIEVSDKAFATNVFPLGLPIGTEAKVEVVGFKLPEQPVAALTVPMTTVEGPMSVGVPMGGQVTNPVQAYATTLPQVLEAAADNNAIATAQEITVPAGVSGRIEAESDIDCYKFTAKKGETYTVQIVARRLLSALDSNLRILNEQGNAVIENDDARIDNLSTSDSWVETWTVPADGTYFLEVRDLHLRGGPEFVYFLKIEPTRPYFELTLDTDKTILAPGTRGVIYARAIRKNGFAGAVDLQIEGLPQGVTATCGRILEGAQDGCIILEAAADAPRVAAHLRVTGKGTHPQAEGQPPLEIVRPALTLQEIYSPGGGRTHYPVLMHTVSIGDPHDILDVKLSETAVTLKPGESKTIKVTITRAPEYKNNITLDVVYQHLGSIFGNSLPAGVKLDDKTSQTLLTGGQTEGTIVLTAAADAKPVENQLVPVMAHVSINFVMKMTYVGQPLRVTIAPADAK